MNTLIQKEIIPNEKQKQCIENTEGQYLVLAGPGTGKTFTLINRIKKILSKGIKADKILCLTFTDAAQYEMRMRLEKETNNPSVGVDIYTYHSFCCQLLDEFPDMFELPQNHKIISNTITRTFIKEIIDEMNPKAFRTDKNDPYYYIETIKRRIEEIKKNRLTKEKYFKNIKTNPDWEIYLKKLENELIEKKEKSKSTTNLESKISNQKKNIEKAYELWDFYEQYQNKMMQNRFLDYNDMISYVLDKFESNPAFLSEIANKYEYILVDEYQDTNKSQNAIIFHLVKALKTQNVFVVGDDDQIIYSFQGARLNTIENFLKEFPDTKVICLNENMRSTQNILDCARAVVQMDSGRLEANKEFSRFNIDKNLIAKNENLFSKNKKVRFINYVDILEEYNSILEEIEELINSKDCPVDKDGNKKLNEIAILTRTNDELKEFSKLFKQRNIPYELKEGKDIFEIKSASVMFSYMQLLKDSELYANKIFEILLCPPFSVNPSDYIKLRESLSKTKSLIEAMEIISADELKEKEKIKNFLETYKYLSEYKNNESIKNTLIEIGTKTGIFNYYLNCEINKSENISALKKLTQSAEEYSILYKTGAFEEFVDYLNISIVDNIPILTDKAPVSYNAVQLLTYYGAKGREFEYVYMPTLISQKWESDNNTFKPEIPVDISEYKDENELKETKFSDRTKVFYTGMTRAKHTLRLSAVQKINGKSKNISTFVEKIKDITDCKICDEYNETNYWQENAKTLIKRDYDYKKEFCELIDLKLANISYSPTSINTYLNCPRQYLYKYILELDTNDKSPDNLNYGSAVHKALQNAVNYALKNKSYPTIEQIIDWFKQKLDTLSLSSFEQRKNLETRGMNAIEKYYVQMTNTPIHYLYKTEYELNFMLDDIRFYGIIDRVDKDSDGNYIIYDYKTGNAKRANAVAPSGEYEQYYNQIGLYKYFFEKQENKKVKETSFIFVEDFKNNLTLELNDEDIEEILKKFKSAINGMREHNFEPCNDESNCKYCQFKSFCQMNII